MVLTSCDKPTVELPEPNDPIFVLSGELGGNALDIVAGDNGAYMHTASEQVNGVTLFTGDLTDGDFSMELGIYDGFIDMPNHIPEDEIANITPKFAKYSSEPLVTLRKSMLGNTQGIESVTWYVNGVLEGNGEVPLTEPGKYDVCAFIKFANDETGQLCNEVIVGYKRGANFAIDYNLDQGILEANINEVGAQVTDVKWYLNDSLISGNQVLDYTLLQTDYELVNLRAEVTFDNEVVRAKSVLVDGLNGVNSVDDFTAFELTSAYDSPQDFNIKIKIKSDGKTYRSEFANNENASITITGIEFFGTNDDGKDVYKISGIVNAVVMEMATEKKMPVTFSTVFGIAID
jgi:hypothetical protein